MVKEMTSSYEEKIIKILQKSKINFEREKTFKDLRGGRYRYDFYIPSMKIICEMDGQYHFQPIKGRSALLKQQENDRQKNSYCLANGIKLYRIPYWEINEIKTFSDITQNKFLVKNRFHNDELWRKFQQNK